MCNMWNNIMGIVFVEIEEEVAVKLLDRDNSISVDYLNLGA